MTARESAPLPEALNGAPVGACLAGASMAGAAAARAGACAAGGSPRATCHSPRLCRSILESQQPAGLHIDQLELGGRQALLRLGL